jgi:hypothetical protein
MMATLATLSPETEEFRIEQETAEIFYKLAAPIEADRVKWRWGDQKKTFKLHYVTARTVMNRLDEVLGPENWWDDYVPAEHSVLCRLSIRLPDGRILTKCDAGGYPGMADEGDDDKGGYSDSFKRAGVKFGIARELYRDGVARLRLAPGTEREPEPEAPPAGPPAVRDGSGAIAPDRGRETDPNNPWFWAFLMDEVETCNRLWRDEQGNEEEIADWGDAVLHMAKVTYGPRFHPYDPAEFTSAPQEWIGTLVKIANDRKSISVDGELMNKGEWMRRHLQAYLSDQWQAAIRRRNGIPPAANAGA